MGLFFHNLQQLSHSSQRSKNKPFIRKITAKNNRLRCKKKSVYTSFFMQYFMQDKTNITL
ncbi:hypothetical protein SEEE2558_14640 [Salmonella enterica subsp. enterica serovar Enteritidis str. 22558]|nr:hypothetical protein SEEE2558_14640 [Salmonella enterica subsp. enterica serovar Enteritidis str. 22558]